MRRVYCLEYFGTQEGGSRAREIKAGAVGRARQVNE